MDSLWPSELLKHTSSIKQHTSGSTSHTYGSCGELLRRYGLLNVDARNKEIYIEMVTFDNIGTFFMFVTLRHGPLLQQIWRFGAKQQGQMALRLWVLRMATCWVLMTTDMQLSILLQRFPL